MESFFELLPKTYPQLRGRPAKYSKQAIVEGVLDVARSGAGWRMGLMLAAFQNGYL